MKASVFFDNSIDINNEYRYEDSFLQYLVIKKIYDNGSPITERELINWIDDMYSCHINESKTFNYFYSFLDFEDGEFDIRTLQAKNIAKTDEFKSILSQFEQKEVEEIISNLNKKYLSFKEFNPLKAVIYLMILQKISSKDSTDKTLSEYFNFITNYDKYYYIADNALDKIDHIYYSLPIEQLFKNEIIKKVLFSNGVNTIGDFFDYSLTFVLTVFSIDFEGAVKTLKSLEIQNGKDLSIRLNELFNSLKERELKILSMRNGFESTKEMTLEEIGSKFDLTRERIRQIEKKPRIIFLKDLNLFKVRYMPSSTI